MPKLLTNWLGKHWLASDVVKRMVSISLGVTVVVEVASTLVVVVRWKVSSALCCCWLWLC